MLLGGGVNSLPSEGGGGQNEGTLLSPCPAAEPRGASGHRFQDEAPGRLGRDFLFSCRKLRTSGLAITNLFHQISNFTPMYRLFTLSTRSS